MFWLWAETNTLLLVGLIAIQEMIIWSIPDDTVIYKPLIWDDIVLKVELREDILKSTRVFFRSHTKLLKKTPEQVTGIDGVKGVCGRVLDHKE